MHRRAVLRRLLAAGGAAALSACLDVEFDDDAPEIPSGSPDDRPDRQHAWNAALETDEHGNRRLPRHHVFRSLSYVGEDRERDRGLVETALTDLERAYGASPDGLLFTVGYSPSYFERFGESLSVDLPPAGPVVPGENVRRDDADAFLHLASDHASAVLGAEAALFGDRPANGTDVSRLDGVFELADPEDGRRTGFVGAGLPADREGNFQGVPQEGVHEAAPNFLNFRSGLKGTQATEDRVTIREGRFAGGTTQHVALLVHTLSNWFDRSTQEQVARMFAPDVDAENVGPVGEELTAHNRVDPVDESALHEVADEHGVVGHAQKMARFREDGRPPILRRDVNTDHDHEAGVVFVSLQRAFEEFRRLRVAMAGLDIAASTPVSERQDNGILQYFRTHQRGNFLIPPRRLRALP
jgi:hypothetical protein